MEREPPWCVARRAVSGLSSAFVLAKEAGWRDAEETEKRDRVCSYFCETHVAYIAGCSLPSSGPLTWGSKQLCFRRAGRNADTRRRWLCAVSCPGTCIDSVLTAAPQFPGLATGSTLSSRCAPASSGYEVGHWCSKCPCQRRTSSGENSCAEFLSSSLSLKTNSF